MARVISRRCCYSLSQRHAYLEARRVEERVVLTEMGMQCTGILLTGIPRLCDELFAFT